MKSSFTKKVATATGKNPVSELGHTFCVSWFIFDTFAKDTF